MQLAHPAHVNVLLSRPYFEAFDCDRAPFLYRNGSILSQALTPLQSITDRLHHVLVHRRLDPKAFHVDALTNHATF